MLMLKIQRLIFIFTRLVVNTSAKRPVVQFRLHDVQKLKNELNGK